MTNHVRRSSHPLPPVNCQSYLVVRGATTAEKLRGPRFGSQFGSQHRCWDRGACAAVLGAGGGSSPSRCEGPGVSPRKFFFENSDTKSCIPVTTCCEIACFLKTMAKRLGDQYIVCPQPKSWGPVSPGPYNCCAYVELLPT